MTYEDLGLVQPEGPADQVGELVTDYWPQRKIPELAPGETITVIDQKTGENITFNDPQAFAEFRYQRYMKRYLRTIQAIDDNVGRLLDYLDEAGKADNTIVIYTSDQGFFLGEHGWFDKRFMYEESLQMPFLVRYPAAIKPGSISSDIACNVDFAPTFLIMQACRCPAICKGLPCVLFLKARHRIIGSNWLTIATGCIMMKFITLMPTMASGIPLQADLLVQQGSWSDWCPTKRCSAGMGAVRLRERSV